MAETFLLPCGCGHKIRVGNAQAGQAVRCECGKSLSVPTLRGLRELESAPDEAAAKGARRAAVWSPWHGAAFSGGLAAAAVSLLLCGANFWYYTGAQHYSEDRSDDVIGAVTGELDNYLPVQLLEEWNALVDEGLSHEHTPLWIAAQESAKVYRWRTIAFGSLGVVSLLVAFGAVFLGRS